MNESRSRRDVPPARRLPSRRVLVAIGVGAVVAGLLLGALFRLAVSPEPRSPLGAASPSPTPMAASSSSAAPGAPSAPGTAQPSGASSPPGDGALPDMDVVEDLLPVKASGREIGAQILMAAGPRQGLYVAIPTGVGELVTLLDGGGRERPGWPVVVPDATSCSLLLAAPDGSVRILCYWSETDGLGDTLTRAFAFDQNGDPMPGWPADISEGLMGAMVGDDLIVLSRRYQGDAPAQDAPEYVHMDVVGANGAVRSGFDVAFPCCDNAFALSPHGIGIVSTREWSEAGSSVTTTLVAFDEAGIRDGWPITIDGNASEVAFDPRGAAHLVVGSPYEPPSRTHVLGPDGRRLGGSRDLAIVSSGPRDGAGDAYPAAPLVASDGSTFIVSTEDGGTTILGLDPENQPLDGWPYRSRLDVQFTGYCGEGDTGCSFVRTDMGLDEHDVLYLIHAASSPSEGGSVVAIRPDGRIRDGWPVGLRRAGSVFWALAANPDGGAYVLAIEPEGDGHSATIVAIDNDSTVRYTTTIVEP